MILNTDIFYPGAKVAVNCITEQEAHEFLNAVIEAYPDKRVFWGRYTCFRTYENSTTYGFMQHDVDSMDLFYGTTSAFEDLGFVVVSCTDVLYEQYKVPEIEADCDIKFLFGEG